ncbi:bacteriophage N4 adsorption protein B [compost metagenome]
MPHRLVDGDPSVRAAAAGFDAASRTLRLRLINGASVALPLTNHPAFAAATDEQLAAVALTPGGEFLRWPALKRQERVPDLLLTLLGFGVATERRAPAAVPPGPKSLLGLLMYREGYLTREQLQGLFQEQMRAQQAGTPMPLGQLAIKAGFMTGDQLQRALGMQEALAKVPGADRGLILYMLESAATTPSALVEALEVQGADGGTLVDVLRQRHLLSDHQLAVFRDRQQAAAPSAAPPAPVKETVPAERAAPQPTSQPAPAPARQESVKSLLGIILEREDYLNQVQVQAIMAEQERLKAAGKTGTFGELAMKLGFITPEQLKFAIQLQQKLAYAPGERKPLGAILLENGVIKPSQVHLALQKQAASGQRLGEVLIEQGAISEHLLQVFLQMQHPAG